ncbi:hypothetical protein XarbCFBP8130_14455 [Xanthomonas arboricola]|uniref:hypothetical protein n=1 Tax=Xanthomonas arboricola TaxID=56448 RepID=UPI000CEE5173|nr:hypothetical protein [Xanthomonas arboricola]PPT57559.1 hypothetical protein XarbCFBP8153_16095 [Xanthomonas arboricola]PPT62786.1 hypothetical protein XarbCFBP8130_14455 [Xanthomonas arboricola]
MKWMRRLIIRAEPHQILDAWCDANVQRRILRGVAELVAGDGHASRWAPQASWSRRGIVRLQRGEARLGESVRYQVDGGRGLQLGVLLHVRTAPGCEGSCVTLSLQGADERERARPSVERMQRVRHLWMGKALRRLRDGMDV